MRNQSKDKSYVDEQLKKLDKDIIWKEKRKSKLENEILFTMDSDRYKTKLLAGFKYALSIGVMGILLLFGYNFLSDSITHQSGENSTGNQGNQRNNNLIIDDKNDHEEAGKEAPENDENQLNSEDVVEDNETDMEIHTGSTETVIRKVEGIDQEVKVINYHIQTYGIAYQLDEVFGVPEVNQNQITYSTQNDDYKIIVEMIEHTSLEKAVSNLQERFETEGYEENFELESTLLEENDLMGKMQFYGYPVKGFFAYEINEHVLVITFQYPEEGGDGMYPLLEDLRKSIHVQ
ncbi:hypothetical protein QGM71_03440 [Virgibacillus sp. C22-A2]|uniref:DUF3298 domain-containing protein n=1 Tax=Virgibacillus tibetensis TaxID=3042313 RepID=A0ABU6KBN1_9BACI|nr:hypothetical protein [Virgibacillus sp. C22-A2]